MKVFIAGATGALGKRLLPLLLERDYEIFGMTRSSDKAQTLERQGVRAIVADAFDEKALHEHLIAIRPELVFHELSDFDTHPETSRTRRATRLT